MLERGTFTGLCILAGIVALNVYVFRPTTKSTNEITEQTHSLSYEQELEEKSEQDNLLSPIQRYVDYKDFINIDDLSYSELPRYAGEYWDMTGSSIYDDWWDSKGWNFNTVSEVIEGTSLDPNLIGCYYFDEADCYAIWLAKEPYWIRLYYSLPLEVINGMNETNNEYAYYWNNINERYEYELLET